MAPYATFAPALPVTPQSGSFTTCAATCARRDAHTTRKRPRASRLQMHFLDPVQTFPEFLTHVLVSCGLGVVGIIGARQTEHARALASADHQAERMDALASDIDSMRRRKELAEVVPDRDWDDVSVDRFSNRLVVPEDVPLLAEEEELLEFDRLLMESPAAKRGADVQEVEVEEYVEGTALPDPGEFLLEEDEME